MKVGKICTLFLIIAAMTAGSVPALAEETASPSEAMPEGGSLFRILSFANDPMNINYDVPLWLPLVVHEGLPEAAAPDNYRIANFSSNPGKNGRNIAVTAVEFNKKAGGSYNTVLTAGDVSQKDDIYLTIGGIAMPPVAAVLDEPKSVDITKAGSAFGRWTNTGGKPEFEFKQIPAVDTPGKPNYLALPVSAEVSDKWKRGAKDEMTSAADAFAITYTISPVFMDKPLHEWWGVSAGFDKWEGYPVASSPVASSSAVRRRLK